jgi:hypothetical protein
MQAMTRFAPWAAAFVAATTAAVPMGAQSLAEVARQEQARRKAIATPGPVYTNDTLRPDPRGAAAPAPQAPAPPADAPPSASPAAATPPAPASTPAPAAAETPPAETSRDESFWRKRLQAERDELRRSQILADALQSRINALSTDFVNRDDPAQRAVIAVDRQNAVTELDRLKQEVARRTKAIAAIREEGRRAGIPAGWVR